MTTARNRLAPGLLALIASTALAAGDVDPALKPAIADFNADRLLGHIKVLASDAFEGRAPGSPGEQKTVAYLTEQFQKLGLKPGNPDGSYVQDVPLVGFTTRAGGTIHVGGKDMPLKFPEDWVAVSRHFDPEAIRGSGETKLPDGSIRTKKVVQEEGIDGTELVFVGYGVVAPEYGWDDYKGLDVRGKTLVMLVNDPAVPAPKEPDKLDDSLFKGRAMTYYGRWTYKYEIAAEKGAAAALIIHETGPAGYPFEVVTGSWGRENFDIVSEDGNKDRPIIEGWLSNDKARDLLKACGQDLDDLKAKAVRKDFRPVSLGAKADFRAENQLREVKSRNVLAKLEGSDPKLKDEYVIYTGHWDHLGRDETLAGDQIFNGAADNASGTAGVLEIARAFTKLTPAPKRSVLFLSVTAEEKGLLGSKYYATHPLYPLAKTLGVINMDVINLWGRTTDTVNVGLGNTTLDDLFAAAAEGQGRTVGPDAEPEKGLFYRSDHFEFAKEGVPALNAKGGVNYRDKPADYGRQKRDEYTTKDYHKVSDEVKPDWDLSGAIEDLALLLEVGYQVAQGSTFPEWKPGTEFKAKRDASLKSAK